MSSTKYITRQGDRLDLVAYLLYGDPLRWRELIDANPALPIISEFPAGLELEVPILSAGELNSESINLPPWKSQQ